MLYNQPIPSQPSAWLRSNYRPTHTSLSYKTNAIVHSVNLRKPAFDLVKKLPYHPTLVVLLPGTTGSFLSIQQRLSPIQSGDHTVELYLQKRTYSP